MNETMTEDRGHTAEILTEAAYQRYVERTGSMTCATCKNYPCALCQAHESVNLLEVGCTAWQAKEAS